MHNERVHWLHHGQLSADRRWQKALQESESERDSPARMFAEVAQNTSATPAQRLEVEIRFEPIGRHHHVTHRGWPRDRRHREGALQRIDQT